MWPSQMDQFGAAWSESGYVSWIGNARLPCVADGTRMGQLLGFGGPESTERGQDALLNSIY